MITTNFFIAKKFESCFSTFKPSAPLLSRRGQHTQKAHPLVWTGADTLLLATFVKKKPMGLQTFLRFPKDSWCTFQWMIAAWQIHAFRLDQANFYSKTWVWISCCYVPFYHLLLERRIISNQITESHRTFLSLFFSSQQMCNDYSIIIYLLLFIAILIFLWCVLQPAVFQFHWTSCCYCRRSHGHYAFWPTNETDADSVHWPWGPDADVVE